MSLSRIGRRAGAISALAVAILLGSSVPASAGTGPGSAPRLAADAAAADELGLADLDDTLQPIKLTCRAQSSHPAVAECGWRTEATQVATYQLWRLELRVDDAARVLVAEVGADTSTVSDTGVTAPGAYLYAVLGLDESGEIVARSRVDRVRFRGPTVDALRLECRAVVDESDAGVADAAPAIGCRWSAAGSDVSAYNLYRGTHHGGRVLIASLGADARGYNDGDVEAGVRYLYRVEAVDASGETIAVSRLDGAGFPVPDRDDRPERDEREPQREERRQERREERADDAPAADTPAAGTAVAVDTGAEAADANPSDGAATDGDPSDSDEDTGRHIETDGQRDPDARPQRDRDDDRERER